MPGGASLAPPAAAAEITARFRNFTPRPEDIALYYAKAGFARPELAVRAYLEIAEKAGATLQFGEPVLEWNQSRAGMRVITGRGSYTAGQLAICPGAWAPQVLGQLGVPITVERQVMYWLTGSAVFAGSRITPSSSTRTPRAGTYTAYRRSTDRGAV